ncbi:hypothetical protein IWZ03DRAFT_168547 [Phyllosticta citriasiana]|uniref:Uncharacterized protein n=1 Tax=Phyllosticta citriasiana TaxID=595635 RepID=A0ABR1KQN4_9PEZI
MGYADKDYNLQEVISMGFYCLVGTGVIVHWIHVWLGKPDHRVRELEARLRSLEEGDRIRDKFALASMGGYPQSVTSSRRGSTTACNTIAGGNNSIFAESLFQATPSKRLRADSYFTTTQHGCPPSENVSPHDTTTPPPLAFPKPPPPSKASQPPSPLCRSPVSPTVTAGGPPPGQAFSCPDPTCNNSSANVAAAALALNAPVPLNKSTNDMASTRGRQVNNNNNNNAAAAGTATATTTTTTTTSPGPRPPPSTSAAGGSRNQSRSRSRSSFRSPHSHQHHHNHHHHPHRYGFHYPHLPHLPPVNSGTDNRVGHMAGMVGPGPLSD